MNDFTKPWALCGKLKLVIRFNDSFWLENNISDIEEWIDNEEHKPKLHNASLWLYNLKQLTFSNLGGVKMIKQKWTTKHHEFGMLPNILSAMS